MPKLLVYRILPSSPKTSKNSILIKLLCFEVWPYILCRDSLHNQIRNPALHFVIGSNLLCYLRGIIPLNVYESASLNGTYHVLSQQYDAATERDEPLLAVRTLSDCSIPPGC